MNVPKYAPTWCAALLSVGLLTACNNNDGNTSSSTATTGVFVDNPVEGVKYLASPSGISGFTNANGEFDYEPNDSITFSIGGITFPTVKADLTVTPLDIFDTTDVTDTSVVNLLRFLQALDSDGNLDNGITISSADHDNAVGASALDFSSASFDADVNNLMGVSSLPSSADAISHFQETLASRGELTGTWLELVAGDPQQWSAITFLGDGRVIYAEDWQDTNNNEYEPGIEFGSYTWNSSTNAYAHSTSIDTGDGFFPSSTGGYKMDISGNDLIFTEVDHDPFTMSKLLPDTGNPLVGSWFHEGSDGGESYSLLFIVLDDTHYIFVDISDTRNDDGFEYGTYTWDANSGGLTVTAVNDDNGDAGLSHMSELAITQGDSVLTMTSNEGTEVYSKLR